MQMTKQTKNVRRKPFLICILLGIFIFSALLGGILFSIPEKKAENDLCDVYINDVDFCSWDTKNMAFCSYNKGLKNKVCAMKYRLRENRQQKNMRDLSCNMAQACD